MATKKNEPPPTTTAQTATTNDSPGRKPWKKKTPVQIVLDQIAKLRDDVTKKEADLAQAKRQLTKLEEVKKVLETT